MLRLAGLFIGVAGWLLLFSQTHSTVGFVALFLLVSNFAPLFVLGAGTSPEHFWVIRRFIPIAFPAFLLAMSWFIWFLWHWRWERWVQARWVTKVTAAALLVLILAGFGQHIRHIARVVEYDGLTEQLEALATELPDEAVLLMQRETPAQQLSLPLWFLFDKTVFAIQGDVKDDTLLETAVAHWQHEGKPVYWIATADTPPPTWQNWQQNYQFTYLIDVPQMEMPLHRIPHQLGRLQLQLDIYTFTEQ